jgi:hypothetical protein
MYDETLIKRNVKWSTMGFALIKNKRGGSVVIATILLTVSSIPAYDNYGRESFSFVIFALLVFLVILRGCLKIPLTLLCKPKSLNPWIYTCLCEKKKEKIQG